MWSITLSFVVIRTASRWLIVLFFIPSTRPASRLAFIASILLSGVDLTICLSPKIFAAVCQLIPLSRIAVAFCWAACSSPPTFLKASLVSWAISLRLKSTGLPPELFSLSIALLPTSATPTSRFFIFCRASAMSVLTIVPPFSRYSRTLDISPAPPLSAISLAANALTYSSLLLFSASTALPPYLPSNSILAAL